MTDHTYYPRDKLAETLEYWGELHIHLDSGAEVHVHAHDTTVKNVGDMETVFVDSKNATKSFSSEKIEYIEYPISE